MALPPSPGHDIKKWVKFGLEDEHLENVSVEVVDDVNRNGLMSDVVFAKATGEKNGQKKTYNLVAKFGKNIEPMRQMMPLTQAYLREIYVYDTIFPYFRKFLSEKQQGNLDYVPKCYKTSSEYLTELLLLEDLKAVGYDVHNKKSSMDANHIEMVLKTYGRWHALSFVLKDQNIEEYNKLTLPLKEDFLKAIFQVEHGQQTMLLGIKGVLDCLAESKEDALLKKLNAVLGNEPMKKYLGILGTVPEKRVMAHSDCWNNNYVFKYDENKRPVHVILIDWQLCCLRPPAFDLSYFLYAVASKKDLDQLERLLKVYYTSLATTISGLGSNPEKLYTFDELMEDWRKYSYFGLINAFSLIPLTLAELENVIPEISKISSVEEFSSMRQKLDIDSSNQEFNRRVAGIVEHFVTFNNIELSY